MKWVSHNQLVSPLDSTTTHSDPGPFSMVVQGYPRYQDGVGALPILDYIKLVVVADFIADSLRPDALPVLSVQVIGHADTDFQRGHVFEQDISVRRAENVQQELRERVDRACWHFNPLSNNGKDPFHPSPDLIQWTVRGVGASEPDADNVRRHKTPANMTEEDRKRNRRVEIILEPGPTPVPRPPDQAISNYIQCILDHTCPTPTPPPPPPPPQPPIPRRLPPHEDHDAWRDFVKKIKDALDFVDVDTILDTIPNLVQPPDPNWRDDFMKEWNKQEEERRQRQDEPPRRGIDPWKDD
jgi:hypothetical protein